MTVTKPPIVWMPAHQSNFGIGRDYNGRHILQEAVFVHTTDGGSTLEALANWFQTEHPDPSQRGSTHFGIGPDGRIGQFVDLANRAYAQGIVNQPSARLITENSSDPNYWGIGIELVDFGTPGNHNEVQLNALAQLVAWLFDAVILPNKATTGAAIDRDHILGHYQADNVTRHFCPSWPEQRYTDLIAAVKTRFAPAPPPVPQPIPQPVTDYKALYLDELRGQLVAAKDDALRASVRVETISAKLLTESAK